MREGRQALREFLERKRFRYCNPVGVIFYRTADSSLYVAAGHPGVEETAEISLGFFQQFDHLTQFMALLRISDPDRLTDVVSEDLFTLYEGELLDIVCTLKGRRPRQLSFRKLGGLIWASNNRKKLHYVRVPIRQPEDFIAYTKRYYKVIDN